MVLLLIKVVVLLVAINSSFGLQLNNWDHSGSASAPCQNMLPASQDEITRRGLFGATAAAITTTLLSPAVSFPALAFDGSGASASAGYSPASKAEKKKKYSTRVIADVQDFIRLGQAIDKGETKGPAWVNFFITFQRKEPDTVGRMYAGLTDLRGIPTKKSNEYEGGDGLLLANTYTKPGKPPSNTAGVKSFTKLSKTFDAIEIAGKQGDVTKAKNSWLITSELLSQYLADVELPSDINDPLYQP